MSECPFERGHHDIDVNDPCPVCGMLGTADAWIYENKCVSFDNSPQRRPTPPVTRPERNSG